MATITKSIGTDGRDYSTITLWEADLGSTSGGSGNDAVGECYADSTFNESVTFDDGTPDSVRLTVPSGQRHDGTASGGGVVVDRGGAYVDVLVFNAATDVVFEWLRMTNWSTNGPNHYAVRSFFRYDGTLVVRNCLIHDAANYGVYLYGGNLRHVLNNVIYDLAKTGDYDAHGIYCDWSNSRNVFNNTIYNVAQYGVRTDTTDHVVKNNISVGCGSGDYSCGTVSADSDYNVDSDGTAPDAAGNSLTSTASNLFVSTVGGSEDLHLKSGADAIGEGTDLGTTNQAEIDIDGDDRTGAAWDIGADQRASGGSQSGKPWWYYEMILGR